tara:strand:+ start:40 stop:255 length:216 start_codon:yes stop_codon:yes gene_type:complete
MEKRLDLEQYVKDLEKHIDTQAKAHSEELAKARTLLEKSLTVIYYPADVSNIKDDIEDYLYGANRNYVNQD